MGATPQDSSEWQANWLWWGVTQHNHTTQPIRTVLTLTTHCRWRA